MHNAFQLKTDFCQSFRVPAIRRHINERVREKEKTKKQTFGESLANRIINYHQKKEEEKKNNNKKSEANCYAQKSKNPYETVYGRFGVITCRSVFVCSAVFTF